ncbi:site-specific integrase [Sinorhizobium sp. BG8]|uniref:tyrosine-type recombinase/integrase n=1 Tax=Sinorhizobium sp. BG8 TaxID=2613773 RepID=UPI00193DE13A|nr:site-specific integrase [Sinorhizobium sp. BG8]
MMVYLYQNELKQARGFNKKTVDAALRHIWQLDRHLGSIDFRKITRQAIAHYKDHLIESSRRPDGKSLSASTIVHALGALEAFFKWLSAQPGYRSIRSDLYAYFTAPRDLREIASAAGQKFVPTMEQLRQVLAAMPAKTTAQRRDRAIIPALLLFGVRDGALISLRLKHVDIAGKRIFQDAREVKTKFSKTNMVDWFPVGDDMEAILIDWVNELREIGAGDDDPLFPAAPFKPWFGLARIEFEFLVTAAPVRKVLKKASAAAGIPYFKPHAIRSTVARLFDEWAASPKELKALSQNLSHMHIGTTFKYYGTLEDDAKCEIISRIRERQKSPIDQEIAERFRNASSDVQGVVMAILKIGENGSN